MEKGGELVAFSGIKLHVPLARWRARHLEWTTHIMADHLFASLAAAAAYVSLVSRHANGAPSGFISNPSLASAVKEKRFACADIAEFVRY